jgi:hypothetical protein
MRIFTLDMQRTYFKKRIRNRSIYYSAKELASQEVKDGRYERLKQVNIIFILEENTTPGTKPITVVRYMDIDSNEVYSDLSTLYEVNLNRITAGEGLPENLEILKGYLSIKNHDDLCSFVNTYDTEFSRRLVTEYMNAIVSDVILLKVARSEKFMLKLTEDILQEEHEDGRQEGIEIGEQKGAVVKLVGQIIKKLNKSKTRQQIIDELELEGHDIEILDNYENYTYLLN